MDYLIFLFPMIGVEEERIRSWHWLPFYQIYLNLVVLVGAIRFSLAWVDAGSGGCAPFLSE